MKQLPLDIRVDGEQGFHNYFAGPNEEAVVAVQRLAQTLAGSDAAPIYLWGEAGGGKTHLLCALAGQVVRQGGSCGWFHPGTPAPWALDPGWRLLVLDGCDRFDAAQQQAAFTLFIEAGTHQVPVAAAGRLPPVDLPLRDDLRSRLGWGLVCQVQPLTEPDRRAVLRREADRRGIFLSDEVMDHLLTRHARDLGSLMGLLDRLDHYALSSQRAVTVPLIRQMLSEQA